MDSRQDYQPFTPKSNGKLPDLSTQNYRDHFVEEREEEKLDLSWLFGVVRRRFLVMAAATIALSALAGTAIVATSKSITVEYEGSFSLLVEPATAEGLQSKLLNNTQAADFAKINIEGISLLDYETQIRILRSPKMMQPVIEELRAWYPKMNYSELSSKMSINRISYTKDGKQQGTKILQVRYKDSDRKKIYGVLDKISKAYLEYSLQQRLMGINQGIKFIDTEMPKLRERVEVLQLQVQRLRQQSNLFEPQLEGKSLSEQVQSIRGKQVEIRVQLKGMRNLYQSYEELLKENNPQGLLMTQGQAYAGLLGQIQKIDSELSMKSAQYREDSLPVLALRKSREELILTATQQAREVVMGNLETQIKEIEARDREMTALQNALNQKIRNFSVTTRQYDNLQRELQVVTKSLSDFLAKRETLGIEAAQQQIPWVLINPPEIPLDKFGQPITATVKQTKKQLALAVILSSLLGIAVGLLVEVLNTVFHTPESLRMATRLPILGVIPFTKKVKRRRPARQRKLTSARSNSKVEIVAPGEARHTGQEIGGPSILSDLDYQFLEAFRSLYTNIHLLSAGTAIRSLLVGSAVAGDGKSTVALHLAATAAAVGQRVLLVDADLRCPQLHAKLGLPNVRGLGDAISTDLSLNDAIQRAPNQENLFVLTAGQIPPDPIKLLSSKKMQYLMEQFQAFFDLVIYDTPPLTGLADTHLIAAHTDATIMVVQIGRTDRSQVRKVLEELKISGASVLGIVANGCKNTGQSYRQRPAVLETLYDQKLSALGTKNPK
ncbi:polysaccharide biosynthesis tyrosine autokinase [Microcoleus vaginatus PCC 9802]|uniref:GumC family protein n=1 Tax=Microcoleus vaginatus TaxID=119532 RepID=UPI00020D2FFC|nr:capsular exopolysaccharide family [Microcoleus vaginatus FGP-2]UNU19726.1 polysaccharide biosynthesis tyrosine autokinase [Microcoleus vaginatus PCC 9802]